MKLDLNKEFLISMSQEHFGELKKALLVSLNNKIKLFCIIKS